MGPPLFPTVFWCNAPEAGLIGAVSLFKFRHIKHLVVAAIILDYPWSLLRGDRGFESFSLAGRWYGAGGEEMAPSSLHLTDGVP